MSDICEEEESERPEKDDDDSDWFGDQGWF
jgi:hypothetical protein